MRFLHVYLRMTEVLSAQNTHLTQTGGVNGERSSRNDVDAESEVSRVLTRDASTSRAPQQLPTPRNTSGSSTPRRMPMTPLSIRNDGGAQRARGGTTPTQETLAAPVRPVPQETAPEEVAYSIGRHDQPGPLRGRVQEREHESHDDSTMRQYRVSLSIHCAER